MRVVFDPIYFVSGYEYIISGRKFKFSLDQVLHLILFHLLMSVWLVPVTGIGFGY
jgi:hypothetical protein